MAALPLDLTETQFAGTVKDLATLRGWRTAHFRSVKVTRADGKTYYATPQEGDPGFLDWIFARRGVVMIRELKSWPRRNQFEPGQKEWLAALGPYASVWTPADWDRIQAELH